MSYQEDQRNQNIYNTNIKKKKKKKVVREERARLPKSFETNEDDSHVVTECM